jgi:hypothetical protein
VCIDKKIIKIYLSQKGVKSMKCFTFHNGDVVEGILANSKGIILGETSKKQTKLQFDQKNPPTLINGLVMDVEASSEYGTFKKTVIRKSDGDSKAILLRILTSSDVTEAKVLGNWSTTGKWEIVATGSGLTYVDSIIILYNGQTARIESESGEKWLIMNNRGSIELGSIVKSIRFLEKG